MEKMGKSTRSSFRIRNIKHLSSRNLLNLIKKEERYQSKTIRLIASENMPSKEVRRISGSLLTSKYAEGYPGKRWYQGCKFIDDIEELTIKLARHIFGFEYANVQPHSGSQANEAVYQALLKEEDCVLALSLEAGGHISHGSPFNFSGKRYCFHFYGLTSDGFVDYEQIERLARKVAPKMVIAGASSYPRAINFEKISQIAAKYSSYFMIDFSHFAGLIAADLFSYKINMADVATTTFQKTLRGPRGGMILAKKDLGRKIDAAVFPGLQGGPAMNLIAARAQSLIETLDSSFQIYQQAVLDSVQSMIQVFVRRSVPLVTGGSDVHFCLIDCKKGFGLSGDVVAEELESLGIIVNKNVVPGDIGTPAHPDGIRIGVPMAVSLGYTTDDFFEIAEIISDFFSIRSKNRVLPTESKKQLLARVKVLVDRVNKRVNRKREGI